MTAQFIKIDWLKGVKVLLAAYYIPGPLAAYLLRHLGAEIIKIESPLGDMMRQIPPFIKNKDNQMAAYFRALNAGFKSIVVDFKTPKGIETLKQLIGKSDVLIDGNRVGYIEKILQEKIHTINPDIIHIPITGYGLKGPQHELAAHDNNVLALAGTLSYGSRDQEEKQGVFGPQIADITSGYIASFMAVSALFGKKNRLATIKPDTIDASMLHAASFLNQIYIAGMNASKKAPDAGSELLNGALPNYTTYKTKDQKTLFFGPIEPHLFKNFCEKINRLDLLDLLTKDYTKLKNELEAIFKTKTLISWKKFLRDTDCCFTPINSLTEATNDEQIKALNLHYETSDKTYGKLKLSSFPAGISKESVMVDCDAPAPELGEHTEEILASLNISL